MIRLILLFWLTSTMQMLAAPVGVVAGEHAGFTRLVVDYGKPVKWQVGRTQDGYELRVDGVQPDYDFTNSFKIIGTSRLVSLQVEKTDRTLRIGVACPCHAIPFEFREGIIVIDLRDGLPPKGSSFESPLPPLSSTSIQDGATDPEVQTNEVYKWQPEVLAKVEGQITNPALKEAVKTQQIDKQLQSLRETLIGQLSSGASQGIIELEPLKSENHQPEVKGLQPAPNTKAHVAESAPAPMEQAADHLAGTAEPDIKEPATHEGFAAARSALGELPSISLSHGLPEHGDLGSKGETCIAADALDVASWRGEGDVAEQMSRATQDIIGEFDRVDQDALTNAVRFYLSIGFGAEARLLMQSFPSDIPEKPILTALSNLVDGTVDTEGIFAGQMACDTPAALWAILENSRIEKGDKFNSGAAYLAFSDLPIDMRRNLGPLLADRFLASGDGVSATKVRDAIARAPGVSGPEIALLDASLDLHDGQPAAAEQKYQTVVDDPGPASTDAIVGLIEARVAQNLPVDADIVEAITGLVKENETTPAAVATQRALILAQAASGDFETAFVNASNKPEILPILWRLLAQLGSDDVLLRLAVLPGDAKIPTVDSETRTKLVTRLFDLGMAEEARGWVSDDSAIDPMLLAKIELELRNAQGVLRLTENQDSPEVLDIRAAALQMIGDDAGAAKVLADLGKTDAVLQTNIRAQNWPEISQTGSGGWKTLAATLADSALPENAPTLADSPLAYGKQLLDQTATTRSAIDGLLSQVGQP